MRFSPIQQRSPTRHFLLFRADVFSILICTESHRNNMKALFWCAQLLLTSSVALLTHASKLDGGYAYNTYSVPFFSELLKVCISAILLAMDHKGKPKEAIDWTWQMVFASSVPQLGRRCWRTRARAPNIVERTM